MHLGVVDEPAECAFSLVQLVGDLTEIRHRSVYVFAIVGDESVKFLEEAGRLAVAVDRVADAAERALKFFAKRADLGHDRVQVGRDGGLDFGAIAQRRGVSRAEIDADVVGADEPGHDDGRRGVTLDFHLGVDAQHGFGAAPGQAGELDGADLHAGHAHFVALLEFLEALEAGDERVTRVLENLTAIQRLKRDPDQREPEKEEEPDAGILL